MYNTVCEDCGKMFQAKTNMAHFCPNCFKKRLSNYAKARKLNEIGGKANAEKWKKLREDNGQK